MLVPTEPPGAIVMPVLLDACPSFEQRWDSHISDEPERLAYVDVGVFADHLVELLERQETGEFPAVFAAVEVLLAHDYYDVRELVQIGLLETLGNVAASRHGWPWAATFRQWFGPLTRNAWDELHKFWGTSDTG